MTQIPYVEHDVVKDGSRLANVAEFGMGVLQDQMDLGMLVRRMSLDQFKGQPDDTVSFRVEGFLPARDYEFRNSRVDPLIMDVYSETKVDITMSGNAYSAVQITDEQNDFDLTTGARLMSKQAEAVGQKLNNFVTDNLVNAPFNFTVGGVATNPKTSLIRAVRMANDLNLPVAGRVFVVGSAFAEILVNTPDLVQARIVGDNRAQSMLEQRTLGQIRGVPVIESSTVPADFGALFVDSAFVLATSSPLAPMGAPFVRYVTDSGLTLRWLMDYDPMRLVDRSVVNTWYGGRHPLDFMATYDTTTNPAAPIMKRTEGMHFLRGIKLDLTGASEAPAASSELGIFSGYDETNLWVPTAPTAP